MPSRPVPAQSVKRAILHYTSKYTSEHLKCASALRGAVAGHLNAAWKDAATRRRCVGWLLDLEGEVHYNDLTDAQVLALKKWVDPHCSAEGKWYPADGWMQETEWVAAEACPDLVAVAETKEGLLAEKKRIEEQIAAAYWGQARRDNGDSISQTVYDRLNQINLALGLKEEWWQMTQALAYARSRMTPEKHRHHVASAYFTGKPVPPEVLADYPDLTHPAPDLEPLPPLVAEAVKLGGMVTARGNTD
jgi:hypothetical protein